MQFFCSILDFCIVDTEYGRHAVDIASKVNLDEVDSLVVVSGDGVLHEVINGLLSRPDWDRARKKSIGIVPAGSGNAIAASLGIVSQFVATLTVIRGETSKLDIFSLSQLNRPKIYSMLSFSWGMMADADIESDKYVVPFAQVVHVDSCLSFCAILNHPLFVSSSLTVTAGWVHCGSTWQDLFE